jgi:predicted SnoaL-like aldol condensation-catalyzing enzyme
MDKMQFQTMFAAEDKGDVETFAPFFHPEMTVHMLGVEGQEAPLDKQGLLEYFKKVVEDRKSQGGAFQHIPSWILTQGDLAAVHGEVRITSPGAPDTFGTFMDFFKLKDGLIIEYNIVFYNRR